MFEAIDVDLDVVWWWLAQIRDHSVEAADLGVKGEGALFGGAFFARQGMADGTAFRALQLQ